VECIIIRSLTRHGSPWILVSAIIAVPAITRSGFNMRRIALCLLLVSSSVSFAQPKKEAAPKAVPGAPTLTTPVTLGLTAGRKNDITLAGTNLAGATSVAIFGCPAEIRTTPSPAKDATKWTVTFDVPESTPIGLYQIRVATENGGSNFRPISIDTVPEIKDNGDNGKTDKAQKIDWPCVVTGSVAAEASDFYRFTVKAGQTINLDCHARRLGSPLDPVLILHDAKTGRELPALYADDTPGLQSDARFVHTFKDSGEYLVAVRDSTYRGGANFDYRLRVTASPAATVTYPAVVQDKAKAEIQFVGLTSSGAKPIPYHPSESNWHHPVRDNDRVSGWPVPVRVSPLPQTVETEPNDDMKSANALSMPSGLTAKFEKKGDRDYFSFPAKKGQKIEAVCMTAEIGSPTEVHLRILDDKQKDLAVSDPVKPAARAEFTAPADGTYFVVTEHLNYLFGPNEVYHLTVKPVLPDFAVTVGVDKVDVPKEGFSLIPITAVTRLNGFNGPIQLKALGKGVAGELTIPPTVTPTAANPVYLKLTGKPRPTPLASFSLQASGSIEGKDVRVPGTAIDLTRAAMGGLTYLPPGWGERFVVADVPKASITVKLPAETTIHPGQTVKVKIEAERDKNADEIAVAVLGLPANVTAKLKPVPKDKKEVEVEIVADAKAALGTAEIYLKGTVKTDAGERSNYAGPYKLAIVAAPKKEEPKKEEKKK
jgi:hypothetical protein